MFRQTLFTLAALGTVFAGWAAPAAEPSPRFLAPTNRQELDFAAERTSAAVRAVPAIVAPAAAGAAADAAAQAVEVRLRGQRNAEGGEAFRPRRRGIGVGFRRLAVGDDHGAGMALSHAPVGHARSIRTRSTYGTESNDARPPTRFVGIARRFTPGNRPAGRRLWLCFDGVDWEAQVYLNGELLGAHRVYYEPFRFDVTGKIRETNTLAVRVIDGRSYGEPMTYWAVFPDIRAAEQRYTPERASSIRGNMPIGYHAGSGFGIHRDVYLEADRPGAGCGDLRPQRPAPTATPA